jgi:uncharacterized protein YdeI (YjbR/CyaY-like superfamily)
LKTNKDRIARATAAGFMIPAGTAKAEQESRGGAWQKLDTAGVLLMPDDWPHARCPTLP